MFQNIRNLFRSFKRRSIAKRGFLVCPKCGSSKVKQADSISGFITPPHYFCQNCYYLGHFIVEVDDVKGNLEEFSAKRKEKKKEGGTGSSEAKNYFPYMF